MERLLLTTSVLLYAAAQLLRYGTDEGPLFEVCWQTFGWPEQLSLWIENAALGLVGAAAAALITPFARVGLIVIFVYAALTAAAAWSLETWHPEVVPAAKAMRVFAPLGLILLLAGAMHRAKALLIVSAAATFAAHGLEALWHRAAFVDLIHSACTRIGLETLPDDRVRTILDAIGVVDLAVAAALLITWRLPSALATHRVLLLWMALWGGVTAASRVVRTGSDGLSDTLTRAPHALVPLALWWIARPARETSKALAPGQTRGSRIGASLLIGALSFLAACESDGSNPPTLEATVPAQLRVVWTEDPQHVATVLWTTLEPGTEHRLYIDGEPHSGRVEEYARHLSPTRSGAYTRVDPDSEPLLHFHQFDLTDLEPARRYWIVASSDDRLSPERSFVTAPDDGRPITLLVGSDSRSRPDRRREMFERVRRLFEAEPEVVAFAHGGDYVYHGDRIGEFSGWLSEYEATTTEDGRLLPILPTRGNHESTSAVFDEVFGTPGAGRGYFATTLNAETLLITLNTEAPAGGDQRRFLEETLTRYRETTFQIAQYHQPLWPAVKRPAAAAEHWLEPFEDLGLDLGLESDGHVLKRTVPIKDGALDPEGVVYIGEGGLGVGQRAPRADRWYLQEPGFSDSAHHVWRLRFRGPLLQADAISVDGRVLDSAQITPRR